MHINSQTVFHNLFINVYSHSLIEPTGAIFTIYKHAIGRCNLYQICNLFHDREHTLATFLLNLELKRNLLGCFTKGCIPCDLSNLSRYLHYEEIETYYKRSLV